MAVKKIETLNKHQNPATNENEFDIENYMNVNWNKIKEVVDNNADELTTTQGKVTTLETDNTKNKQDISDIKTEQETQNDLLQRTQSALINITTEKSSNINVKDSSDLNAKIDVYGSSNQKTRSGKNKANSSAYNYDTVSYQDLDVNLENNEFTISTDSLRIITEYIKVPIKINENGTYTFGLELKANTSGATAQALVYDSTNKKIIGSPLQNDTTTYAKKTTTITIDDAVDKSNINVLLYCEGTVGNAYSYSYKNIFVNLGQDDEFEQYGASPSPKYPSEIENAGDNINVFNLEEFIEFYSLTETGTDEGHNYIAYTTKTYENNKFMQGKFKANTQYTISFLGRQKQAAQGQTTGFVFNYTDGTRSIKYVNNDEIWTKYTLTSDKNKTIDYVSMAWAYGGTIWLSDIKLEEGPNATSFSEYGCGNIDITVCNKNLFSVKKWKKIVQSMGYPVFLDDSDSSVEIIEQSEASIKYNQKATYCGVSSDYMKVKKGQKFELQFEYENINRLFITQYDKNKKRIKELNSTSILSATKFTIENDGYITIAFSYSSATVQSNTIEIKNILLALNEITGSFVEPEQQLITFPLAEGQRLADRDKFEDDGIHHVRKQIELDGTENVIDSGYNTTTHHFTITFDDKKIGQHGALSNMFVNSTVATLVYSLVENSSFARITFKMPLEYTTVDSFKTFLAQQKENGTPVIVEYELETEEIEAYTEEQQEAYNKLQNVLSYYNVTNVFTDKALLEFKYIADTQTWVLNKINNTNQQVLNLAGGN